MKITSSSLLKSRDYWPLLLTSFFGAMNDNLIRAAIVVLAVMTLTPQEATYAALAATGLLMLPFFLFSGWSGTIADKFDKAKLLKISKVSEMVLALLAFTFFYLDLPLLYVLPLVFLMGTQSAFFGPIKQGWLPERIKHTHLVQANAWLDGTTQIAIVGGTIIGGGLIGLGGPIAAGIGSLTFASIGLFVSLFALPGAANEPSIPFPKNPFQGNIKLVKEVLTSPLLKKTSLIQTWFWGAGAVSIALLPTLLQNHLQAGPQATTLIMAFFSVGVCLGAFSISKILKGSPSLWTVPASAGGIAISCLLTYISLHYLPQNGGLQSLIQHWAGWGIILGVVALAAFGGAFVVPLHSYVQRHTHPLRRSRQLAGLNVITALTSTLSTLIAMSLIMVGFSPLETFGILTLISFIMFAISSYAFPREAFQSLFRLIFFPLFRVKVIGQEHLNTQGPVVFVSNHVSLLDGPLLFGLITRKFSVAVVSAWANGRLLKPLKSALNIHAIDPQKPMSAKHLVQTIAAGGATVIFPEGRITVTGGQMKLNQGTAWMVDKSDAQIVSIHIEGLERSKFSKPNTGWIKSWLPKVRVVVSAPQKLNLPEDIKGKARRELAIVRMRDIMEHTRFMALNKHENLVHAILDAESIYSSKSIAYEDVEGSKITRSQLSIASKALSDKFKIIFKEQKTIGLLLPAAPGVSAVLMGLWRANITPAMINPTVGALSVISALNVANTKTILSSKAFVEKGKFTNLIETLEYKGIKFIWTEDIKDSISLMDKIKAKLSQKRVNTSILHSNPAAILFTSGTEGTPKGVVLTHGNILSNISQIRARTDISPKDVALSALPLFHSFGLTAGLILPLLSGIRTGLHPSPLHYRIIPEFSYNIQATLLFGTDTFLTGWARRAAPEDFASLRAVVAGAEAVKESTRKTWADKFGVRILEGYGATECSPVLSLTTPSEPIIKSVGRILPGMSYKMEKVDGVEGGRLWVKGPNIMAGYLKHENPGVIESPKDGWYDTGDIVTQDISGQFQIVGRLKRFAKVGGEMVSLSAVENFAASVWPDACVAALSYPHPRTGEHVILFTDKKDAKRADLLQIAKSQGIGNILLPTQIVFYEKIPLLASGKTDYPALKKKNDETMK